MFVSDPRLGSEAVSDLSVEPSVNVLSEDTDDERVERRSHCESDVVDGTVELWTVVIHVINDDEHRQT